MVPCEIDAGFTHFKRCCKRAAKRHRSFPDELAKVFAAIEADALTQGDRIPGYGPELHLRKVRIGIPLDRIPPSGGYRLIFQLLQQEGSATARCLDLYYKPEQADISSAEGIRLIAAASDRESD